MRSDRPSFFFILAFPLAVLTSVALVGRVQGSQSGSAEEQFSATAVNMDAGGSGAVATPVTITINRWSTDAERDRLNAALKEQDTGALLHLLQGFPRAGTVALTGTVGTPIQFARRSVGASGTERVTLVTDRPISVWEAHNAGRSLEYPFTFVEMSIGPDGKGEGKASVATKVIYDPEVKELVLENFTIQPVALRSVQRLK